MRITDIPKITNQTIVTIGTFDGVHLGHVSIFNQIKKIRNEFFPKSKILIITFRKSPKSIINPKNQYAVICSLKERLRLIRLHDIDYVIPIDFDQNLRNKTAFDFLNQLKSHLNLQAFVLGKGTTIGNDRISLENDLKKITDKIGVGLFILPHVVYKNQKISSSQIKDLIKSSDLSNIKESLGRNFSLTGKVIRGKQRGKALGYATANLEISLDQCLPKSGIYITQSSIGNSKRKMTSVTSVGTNPTFESNKNPSTKVETHIIDFNDDIYYKTLNIEFEKFLRAQIKYKDSVSLKNQMEIDVANVKNQIT